VDFDVLNPCTLVSVKVYTDTPGNREIELRDDNGNVVNNLLVNIPLDSSRITLNFPLVPGINYSLTTNTTVNMATLGTATPRLQRSSMNVSYPYMLNNLVTITGSNQGSQYYYYFYDWEVQEPSYVCVSDRVPVIADITTGLNSVAGLDGILIYPNPASHSVTIEMNQSGKSTLELYDVTGRMLQSKTYLSNPAEKIVLDLSGVAKGSYNLKVQTSSGSVVPHLTVN
jgi:hypothetical protein